MVEAMEALGFVRFRLAGHDRGGRVAYRLALDHPGRLEKLAVLDIVPTWDMWHRIDARLAYAHLALDLPGAAGAVPRDADRPRSGRSSATREARAGAKAKDVSVFDPRALAHYHAVFQDPLRIHATCEDYRAGRTTDLAHDEADRAAGNKIACPVLALWGAAACPPMPASIRSRPGANGRRTCAASPSSAGITCRRRIRPRPRGHCWNSSARAKIPAMTTIDRQSAFSGTKEVAEPLRFDVGAARSLSRARTCRALPGRSLVQPVQGRPVQSDLSAGNAAARATCCGESRRASCCPRRTRSTANSASSARLHAQGFPVAEPVLYCADDSIVGTRVLRHGLCRGPRVLGAADAGAPIRPSAPRSTTP